MELMHDTNSKVEVKKKSGKLAEHFSSLSHKSALIDFSNFLSNTNHIDCI